MEEKNQKHLLLFHPKWEKGISSADRELIRRLYTECGAPAENEIIIRPIRAGINYKGYLFATVLVQNGEDAPLHFLHRNIIFIDHHGLQISQDVHIPDLVVKENSSTPWTFIFDKQQREIEEVDVTSWSLKL